MNVIAPINPEKERLHLLMEGIDGRGPERMDVIDRVCNDTVILVGLPSVHQVGVFFLDHLLSNS